MMVTALNSTFWSFARKVTVKRTENFSQPNKVDLIMLELQHFRSLILLLIMISVFNPLSTSAALI